MKTTQKITTVLAIAASAFLASCSFSPKGDEAKVGEAEEVDSLSGTELLIDTASSKIGFTGYGVGKEHPGYFKISSGKVAVSNGKISGGNFVINTTSLSLSQQESMFQTKLKGHLLSADFFDVEKYPTANFEITAVEPFTPTAGDSSVISGANYKVSGNFTLRGVTKNVTFPARVDLTNGSMHALASFNIDRNLWDMKYGNDKSLKDKFISETVNITFDIKSN